MKYLKMISVCFLCGLGVFAQTVEKITDKASVAQEKRQVYEKWGDFKPDPWSVIGIPTNPAYYTVWFFDSGNRNYKNGSDIRPLKPNGLGMQSALMTQQVKTTANDIKDETEENDKQNEQEFLHITHLTTKADVLYNLYYKLKFEIFYTLPNLTVFERHYFKDSVHKLRSSNLQTYFDNFLILKDKLEASFDADMPRGKRYLIYHKIMLDLRRLEKKMNSVSRYQKKLIVAKRKMQTQFVSNPIDTSLSDRKLFIRLISDNPDFY